MTRAGGRSSCGIMWMEESGGRCTSAKGRELRGKREESWCGEEQRTGLSDSLSKQRAFEAGDHSGQLIAGFQGVLPLIVANELSPVKNDGDVSTFEYRTSCYC